LHVADEVGAPLVTCPKCLGQIPNPGQVGPGTGTAMAIAVEDEARRDRRRTGFGAILLVALVAAGIGFGVSFALSALGQSGRYGGNLLGVWLCVGGLAGLVILCLTTYAVARALSQRMPETERSNPFFGLMIVFVALVTGIGAALLVLGLTCGAIIGGGTLGGGL
jgi:hypothetical protein